MKNKLKMDEELRLQDPPKRDYDFSYSSYNKIKEYLTTGPVLDIGCKSGALVYELIGRGFDAYGIDMGPRCSKQWNNHKDNFLQADITKAVPAIKKKFEVIVMSHVLEHVENPMSLLINLKEILLPKGKIFIEVPLGDTKDLAHHFIFEDIESLHDICGVAGYEVIKSECTYRSLESREIAYIWLSL